MTPDQYRYLISELARTVAEDGGRMPRLEAERATARRLGMSIADMQGISINAHADKALVYHLRTDSLAVPEPTEPVHWAGEPGEGPTSLHGNGAASFARTSGDEDDVTCKLCLTLLARESTESDPVERLFMPGGSLFGAILAGQERMRARRHEPTEQEYQEPS